MVDNTGPVAATPSVFRLNIEVDDLDAAAVFYGSLLATAGRRQAGERCYFTCGPLVLQVLDVSGHADVQSLPKSLYFSTSQLETVHDRARHLGCLSTDPVHGEPGGEISVRPWGERSFYVDDPWGNSLCFVEEGTTYVG